MSEIRYIKWKNLDGIQIENAWIRAVILPDLGGKIAPVCYKKRQFEFAAQYRGEVYRLPGMDADFSDYDAAGLDDAFPNIVKAEVSCGGKGKVLYPDHGEIWSSRFSHRIREDGVELYCISSRFAYRYRKRIALTDSGLTLSYEIENEASEPLPCLWAFHGLARYEKDMELFYPENIQGFENVLCSPELGEAGRHYGPDGSGYDFGRMPGDGTMVKYYVGHKLAEGHCGYRYPSQGVECLLEYDASKLPYLGVWITTGGYRGDCNCALEPASGYYDDIRIAAENNSLCMLEKGKPFVFSIAIKFREI